MPTRIFSIKNLQQIATKPGFFLNLARIVLSLPILAVCFILHSHFEQSFLLVVYGVWYMAIFFIASYWGVFPGIFALMVSIYATLQDLSLADLQTIDAFPKILRIGSISMVGGLLVWMSHRQTLLSQTLAAELLEKENNQSQREQLSMITEGSNDLIVLSDENGKIVYLNRRARDRLGSTKISDLNSPDQNLLLSQIFEPSSNLSLQNLTPKNISDTQITTGRLKSLDSILQMPVRLSQIEVPGRKKSERLFALIFYDQSLEYELDRRIRVAKGHLPMVFWSYDLLTGHYEASVEHDQILGSSQGPWSLERLLSRVELADRNIVNNWMMSLSSPNADSDFDLIFRVKTDKNEIRWVHSVGVALKDGTGKVVRVEGVLLNITSLKQSEEELRQAVQLRDHFFAIASHELKTPIASLNLQIEVLKECIEANIKENEAGKADCMEVIKECEQQYKRLTNLVNDFLDVARLSKGKFLLSLNSFAVKEWIESTIKLFPPNANLVIDPKSLQENDSKLQIEADRERLSQVLINLISNAIKFGLNKPIQIRYGIKDENFWFTVTDHGIGINPKDIRRIFDEFEQSTLGKQMRGLGLGLYITREIVRAHSGQIQVQSEIEKGTTFEIMIPKKAKA